eukprot:tig00021357_g20793.t1
MSDSESSGSSSGVDAGRELDDGEYEVTDMQEDTDWERGDETELKRFWRKLRFRSEGKTLTIFAPPAGARKTRVNAGEADDHDLKDHAHGSFVLLRTDGPRPWVARVSAIMTSTRHKEGRGKLKNDGRDPVKIGIEWFWFREDLFGEAGMKRDGVDENKAWTNTREVPPQRHGLPKSQELFFGLVQQRCGAVAPFGDTQSAFTVDGLATVVSPDDWPRVGELGVEKGKAFFCSLAVVQPVPAIKRSEREKLGGGPAEDKDDEEQRKVEAFSRQLAGGGQGGPRGPFGVLVGALKDAAGAVASAAREEASLGPGEAGAAQEVRAFAEQLAACSNAEVRGGFALVAAGWAIKPQPRPPRVPTPAEQRAADLIAKLVGATLGAGAGRGGAPGSSGSSSDSDSSAGSSSSAAGASAADSADDSPAPPPARRPRR